MTDYNLRKHHSSLIVKSSSTTKLSELSHIMPQLEQEIKEMSPIKAGEALDSPTLKEGNGITLESHKSQSQSPEKAVIEIADFSAVNMEEKLNLLMVAINKVNTNLHMRIEDLLKKITTSDKTVQTQIEHISSDVQGIQEVLNDEQEGVLPRMRDLEEITGDVRDRLDSLETAQATIQDQIFALKGIAQVNDRKLDAIDQKVIKLTAQSMQNNIILQGIDGDTGNNKEPCKEKVLSFLRDKMQVQLKDSEVVVAHRIGPKKTLKPRPMVVCCKPSLRFRVFASAKNLKDQRNDLGDFYQISPQFPEPISIQRKEIRERMNQVHKTNDQMHDSAKKVKIELKNGSLFLEGKIQKKYVFPPLVTEMMNISPEEQRKMDQVQFVQSSSFQERGNVFSASALCVSNTAEVKSAYRRMKQLYPDADHIMMAYQVKNYSGYHDHGEHGAGKRISSILADRNTSNVAVFVTRIFSGHHIGPKRFILIEKVVKEALKAL